MLKKSAIFGFMLLYLINGYAQSKLNAYKYVIVPKRFEFFKEDDKYRLNGLMEFLFKKQGFETVWLGDPYPNDLQNDPCLGLKAGLKNNSNMFTTKLIISLTDCRNQVVFESEEGRSKEKEYKKSYQDALRKAFISIEREHYRFEPEMHEEVTNRVRTQKPVVTTPVKEPIAQKPVSPEKPVPVQPATKVANTEKVARSYRGDRISFFLIAQGDGYVIYVNESKDPAYKKGEQIGTLQKTSLPNVYRINWKVNPGKYEDSTAYFDEEGNLKIDVKEKGKIRVREFKVER